MKNLLKFTFALLFVFFLVNSSQAAGPKIIWRAGQLELWDRTTLEGDLAYNWAAEMVSLRETNGRIRTFSANQVGRFTWFDYSTHKLRVFISLAKPVNKDYESQVFHEICMDGPLTVVRRLKKPRGLFKRWLSHPATINDQPEIAQDTDLFNYFVYDAGQLLNLDRFHKDIYTPLMTTYDRELNQYVLNHNINNRTLAGRLVLIDRFNWMVQHDPKAASNKEAVKTAN
ncbi:hypothetical protein [Spirosoma aerophilum]